MVLLGSKIRAAREQRGLNLTDLAKLAHTSRDTVRRAERGDNTPAFTAVARIARALEIPLDELHHEEDDTP